ncbi:MAG: excisionase family binding protein [Spirosoma sp.]|nr:excisionase family binding protein [Spirosoma sp.]
MSDLTDVKFFLASLLRPIVREAVREELANLPTLPSTTTSDEVLTYDQAAVLLNLTAQTLYGKVSRCEIPFSKVGNRTYFSKQELLAWLHSQRTPTISEQAQQYEQNRAIGLPKTRRGGRKVA